MCGWNVEEIAQAWLLITILPAMTILVWGALVWGGFELGKAVYRAHSKRQDDKLISKPYKGRD